MKRLVLTIAIAGVALLFIAAAPKKKTNPSPAAGLGFDEIIFVERDQYLLDHHNTETLFQKGEINEEKFRGGSALRALNVNTGKVRTLIASDSGVVRDPELSYDARKVIFSMRPARDSFYHIYEINIDGTGLKQLTRAEGISDIDPLYLPDGRILFSSTREPKYCMCNRHIMCNLYRMEADGANITQLGHSTLFEGHSTMLPDGRVIYDRWEYVDRNFGDAQSLWTMNPDGTKHSIYYGNNMPSPGGVIDPRPIPGTDLVTAIFGSCHDRPWGALVILDRKQGVDGAESVMQMWPDSVMSLLNVHGLNNWDQFMKLKIFYEDPYPLSENKILVSRSIRRISEKPLEHKTGIYLIDRTNNSETLICEGTQSVFDPQPVVARTKPPVIPEMRGYADAYSLNNSATGYFYVQNVYEGTHMQGVEPGTVKYIRVVETPEKRTWTPAGWSGQGEQAPAVNWSSFEVKVILGETEVAADGSAYVEVPANKFVYFQLLDKDRKMVQTMRSGTVVLPGEVNGCIGCHEDRLMVPMPSGNMPLALQKKPVKMDNWRGISPHSFGYTRDVQPIFDAHCMSCHDFDPANRRKLVLSGDHNPFFNASYVNLYVQRKVKLIGGGPAEFQAPRSWGSHASKLTAVVDDAHPKHPKVNLSQADREMLYAWMDINGVYYPVYESAYPNNMAGRSPLTNQEANRLSRLTGVNLWALNGHGRGMTAQVSFERPAVSPILDSLLKPGHEEQYAEALALIALGGERLKQIPRADMEGFVPCEIHQEMLRKYALRLEEERAMNEAIRSGEKRYDR